MHTGSASIGLPNGRASASIKRLLTSIKETASKTYQEKNIWWYKTSMHKVKINRWA